MFFMQKFTSSNQYTHHKKLKIGVVQVGLYYQLGGSTADFFPELLKFLKNNNDVDIVAFSENTVYGFKDEFNKRITLEMISDLNKSKAQQHHAFIFNFFGFNNINNAVSVYVYKDKNIINQKTTLIPFVEQKWAFSIKNDDLHEYLSIHKNIINKNIN
ncbi:aatD, apolipoN-acyltransferase domain protein, partial [Escherichia coli MP021017.1]